MLDFSRSWVPYIYLYGVGGGIFLIGMFIILRSRSLKLERVRHKEWYKILIFGFVYYLCIHGVFSLFAVRSTAYHPNMRLEQITFKSPFEYRLINESVVDTSLRTLFAWDGLIDSSFNDEIYNKNIAIREKKKKRLNAGFDVMKDDSAIFFLDPMNVVHHSFRFKKFKKDSICVVFDSSSGLSDSIVVLDSSTLLITSGLRLVVKNSPSSVDTLYSIKQLSLIDSSKIKKRDR
jgi:hypothetical protein